jgi:hypothetical protein
LRSSGLRATSRDSAATTTFWTIQAVEIVPEEIGAGQEALQRMPSGATNSTARMIPSFQRIRGARIGSRPVKAAPRMPEAVQLMKPGACGEVPVMSSVSRSPVLVAVTQTW